MKLKLEHKQIPKESTVIVGVSGGRDSMALVHALTTQRLDLNVIAAHVNHKIRHDADEDAAFANGMMQRWHIDFFETKLRPPKTGNLEEFGRDKRYEFFEKLRKKHKAAYILTAHHQDDDFESMMLHFLRGTRVKGLSGMQIFRDNILRPLLYTSRDEIDAYIAFHQIPYRDDPSNNDENFKRNFLRHKVVPVLNHVYPGLAQRWQEQKQYWLDLQTLLESQAALFMDEFLSKKEGLDRRAYAALPFPVRATILELWYRRTSGEMVPDAQTINRWDNAILTFEPRKKTEWHGKKFLVMKKERAMIG